MAKLFSSATNKITVCLILYVSEDTFPLKGLAKIKILIVVDLIIFYYIVVPVLSRIKVCIYQAKQCTRKRDKLFFLVTLYP